MAKKNGKPSTTPSNTRPKSTSSLSQGGTGSSSSSSSSSGRILTRFASSGSFFAQASLAVDAHTIRIFDVASGSCTARWASPSTSNERIECVEWAELQASASSSEDSQGKARRGKKRRKSSLSGGNAPESSQAALVNGVSHPQPQLVLCIGLSNGSIHLLHPTQSSILQTLQQSSSTSSIQSIFFPRSSTPSERHLLWSCSANGQILAWNLPSLGDSNGRLLARYEGAGPSWSQMSVRYSEEDAALSSSAGSSNGASLRKAHILVAQHAIKLLEVELPQTTDSNESALQTFPTLLKASFTGHTSKVSQLLWHAPAPSSAQINGHSDSYQLHFLSSADDDRTLNVWSTPASLGEGAEGLLSATIALEDNVETMSLSEDGTHACAVLVSGSAALLPIPFSIFSPSVPPSSSDRKKRRKSIVASLSVATHITAPSDGTGITDSSFHTDSSTLRLARNPVKPTFETVQTRDGEGEYRSTISIGKKGAANGVLIGADNSSTQSHQRAQYSETARSAVLSGDATQPDNAPSAGKQQPNGSTPLEPTLAQRLKGLQVEQNKSTGADEAIPSVRTRSRKSGGKVKIADATSLSQSLVQALHSSDARLLESCLQRSDTKIIRNTVRRLPNTLVLTLVEALVERLGWSKQGFGSGTGGVDASRGASLVEWLRHVLTVHLAYLITIPALVTRLASLHSTLDSRVTYHNQLLALNGRLDLVVSQIDLHGDASASQRYLPASGSEAGLLQIESSGPSKYVEGETSSESESEEEAAVDPQTKQVMNGQPAIQPAEEGADIEDLVMGQEVPHVNGKDKDEADDGEDEDGDENEDDEEDDMPALRKGGLTKVNGFLELEASESEGDGSDEEEEGEGGISSASKRKPFSLLNSKLDEDPEEDEEDGDELDRYESDFINDESEEDGESEDEE